MSTTESSDRIIVMCPKCQKKLKLRAEMAEKRVRCPGCHEAFKAESVRTVAARAPDAAPPSESDVPAAAAPAEKPAPVAPRAEAPAAAQPRPRPPAAPEGGQSRENRTRGRYRGWRDWRRALPQQRSTAMAVVQTLVESRRVRNLLWITLIVSILVHAPILVGFSISQGSGANMEDLAGEDSYLKKAMMKQIARNVAKEVQSKLAAPPPPPDPEGVVQSALSESLTTDVEKVTAGLLEATVQSDLLSQVKNSLKDDLAAAAKDIAQGKMSEDQIKQMHQKFQEKAQDVTKKWREEYLEKTQIERAAMTTTEWYEKDVAGTLFPNISFELFRPANYNSHPPSPEAWNSTFTGGYGWGKNLGWFRLTANDFVRGKAVALDALAQGGTQMVWSDKEHKNVPKLHASWPGPSADQAKWMLSAFGGIQKGTIREDGTYPSPSWASASRGKLDRHNLGTTMTTHMSDGLLNEYFPQALEATGEKVAKADELWQAATEAIEAYVEKADAGGDAEALKAPQAAAFAAVKTLQQAVAALPLSEDMERQRAQVNWAVLNDVLRKDREKMYKYWVDKMLAGLEPLVRDFARGQFKKGIIKNKEGVDEAMKEFTNDIVPLIRRDIEKMLPKKSFVGTVSSIAFSDKYKSPVSNQRRMLTDEEVDQELAAAKAMMDKWPEADRPYAQKREELNKRWFQAALDSVVDHVMTRVMTGNMLTARMASFVEGVDTADKLQEKLDARAMALKGRGQDLAKLTKDGVPDVSAPLFTLMYGGSKGQGANLQPMQTLMQPALMTKGLPPQRVLKTIDAVPARAAAKWGFHTQAETKDIKISFQTPKFEAIPFLPKFPKLDGDLGDWGEIRPLFLQGGKADDKIAVYAAWNYQGFFFGYRVRQPDDQFFYVSSWVQTSNHNTGDVGYVRAGGIEWAARGDHFHLLFDTLDARSPTRGEAHTQEFIVFPRGTESDGDVPGVERVIESKRDAQNKDYRGVKASGKIFAQQPPLEQGPDGTGPYRVTRPAKDGYTTEIFLPRSIFKQPVFSPGWFIGFDCAAATGVQSQGFKGQAWAGNRGDNPNQWGDLLLLGTDPKFLVQEASAAYDAAPCVVPGQSYLVTVVDPDRNVYPSGVDTVLVSAEVQGGNNDVEVFVLQETGVNTGIFRGFVNTTPGFGREVQGVLECLPLQEVGFSYVDVADSKGRRNVVNEIKLPVIAAVMTSEQPGENKR